MIVSIVCGRAPAPSKPLCRRPTVRAAAAGEGPGPAAATGGRQEVPGWRPAELNRRFGCTVGGPPPHPAARWPPLVIPSSASRNISGRGERASRRRGCKPLTQPPHPNLELSPLCSLAAAAPAQTPAAAAVTEADRAYMRRALELASRALGETFPNPAVGCVIVNDAGEIVGEGYHPQVRPLGLPLYAGLCACWGPAGCWLLPVDSGAHLPPLRSAARHGRGRGAH